MNSVETVKKMCLSKKPLTKREALQIISEAQKEKLKLYSYFCPICSKYHLTRRSPED